MTDSTPTPPPGTPAASPLAPAAAIPPPPIVPVVTMIGIDDFTKVRLVTARVLSAVEHPSADKLLILQLDIGQGSLLAAAPAASAAPRQICAGIRGFYNAADLVGKTIIIVENLKPRKLRGEMSQGMLLAVHDGDRVSLLTTDAPVAPGLVVG